MESFGTVAHETLKTMVDRKEVNVYSHNILPLWTPEVKENRFFTEVSALNKLLVRSNLLYSSRRLVWLLKKDRSRPHEPPADSNILGAVFTFSDASVCTLAGHLFAEAAARKHAQSVGEILIVNDKIIITPCTDEDKTLVENMPYTIYTIR